MSLSDMHEPHWISHQPSFIRSLYHFGKDFGRPLVVGLGIVVVAFVGWGGFAYYKDSRGEQAAIRYGQIQRSGVELASDRSVKLQQLINDYPKTGAAVLASFNLAATAYEQKDYPTALKLFEPMTELTDAQAFVRVAALHNMAAIHEAQGDLKQALSLYQRAAADPANSGLPLTYYRLGLVSGALGETAKAREWLKQASEKGKGLSISQRAQEHLLWLSIKENS